MVNAALFLIKEDDIPYEEDCLRNPFAIKTWLRYHAHKAGDHDAQVIILRRAVSMLPGSYKLWMKLLEQRTSRAYSSDPDQETGLRNLNYPLTHPDWQKVNHNFEQSLILCHKFPLIWLAFCEWLMHQPNRITYTRRTFDRALKALPPTQHSNLWSLYLKFANLAGGETCIRVWRRYLKVQPSHAEQYVDKLLGQNPPRTAEAARVLATIIEDPKFASTGKTLFQYWVQLCDLICQHPDGISLPAEDHLVPNSEHNSAVSRPDCLNVESIMRAGISRWSDQVGTLWHSLAKWWVLRGELERAR